MTREYDKFKEASIDALQDWLDLENDCASLLEAEKIHPEYRKELLEAYEKAFKEIWDNEDVENGIEEAANFLSMCLIHDTIELQIHRLLEIGFNAGLSKDDAYATVQEGLATISHKCYNENNLWFRPENN